jgi:NTP pyrophosphatase (non-canonical NTP hydrolase)
MSNKIEKPESGRIADRLNTLQDAIHFNAKEKGFYEGVDLQSAPSAPTKELVSSLTANLHGEVSEFWEAFRNGKLSEPCDKADKMNELGLLELTCAEEELADIVIRAFDAAGALGLELGYAIIAKHNYNTTRSHRHGGKQA